MRPASITHTTEACEAGFKGDVIPVDVASAKAVAVAKPITQTERLPLSEARGRVLAVDLQAAIDLPPFNSSAMDGYAIRMEALKGDGPWTLPVAGRLAAGDAAKDS